MNQQDQKRGNQELILGLLRSKAAISQVEIAELCRLQTSTVSNLVRAMKEAALVRATGKSDSGPSGGKKAELLSLNPDYGSFGGLFIKNDEILSCMTDFTGAIVDRRSLSIKAKEDREILRLIIGEIKGNTRRRANYRGTGIAVSSVVSSDGDLTKSRYFNHAIPDIIARIRIETPNLPLAIENDANCAAYYDHQFFGGRYRYLVHLHVPTKPFTIGAGIVINGELYRGARGAAGEVAEGPGRTLPLEAKIERTIRFAATLLDVEALFITGDFTPPTTKRVRALAERLTKEGLGSVELLDNPDLPVLGASLQAIRLHTASLLDGRSVTGART